MDPKATLLPGMNRRGISGFFKKQYRMFSRNLYLWILVLPGIAFVAIFYYIPMIGISVAFTDYKIGLGFFQAPFVGLQWFGQFFQSIFFWRLLRNTALLGFYAVLFGFPFPVFFALLLNEMKGKIFKRTIQSVSYLPHFISTVIIIGMTVTFLQPGSGILWVIVNFFTPTSATLLADPKWFRPIYIITDIWQTFGWNSIMFLAALSSVDPQLYESSRMDGANRWQQVWSITLPSILPTVLTLLILRMGSIVDVGFEKAYLLGNPATYETSDVISTYVYRTGILNGNFSFATAVGLFNSAINIVFLFIANTLSKKFNETSLW